MFYLFLLAAEHNGNYSRNLPYATKLTQDPQDENKTETVCSWNRKKIPFQFYSLHLDNQ